MFDIVGLLIVIFVFSRFFGLAKSQGKKRGSNEPAKTATKPENKGYSSYNSGQESYNSSNNTITRRMEKQSQKATPEDSLTEIEKRRKEQHESHMDKRIHRNVHADDERWEEEVTVTQIQHIRDLIVCGYPTDIPNQRDFVKEGEDFLARLSSNSMFL